MDCKLILKLTREKLNDRGTYTMAFIVGTLINLYGQLLVPWLRGSPDPVGRFLDVFDQHTGTTVLSVVLGYAFPLFVGTYSTVATRYKNRRIESVADFPDRKPDPVFRVDCRDGELIEAGAETWRFLERYKVTRAEQILGEAIWTDIKQNRPLSPGTTVRFQAEGARYAVAYVKTQEGQVNIYMTRLGP